MRRRPTSSRRPTAWATAAASASAQIELPLSVPLIVAGLRLASVSTIGLVTITATLGELVRRPGLLHPRGLQPRASRPRSWSGPSRRSCWRSWSTSLFVRLQRRLTPWTRREPAPGPTAEQLVIEPDGAARLIAWLLDPANWSGPNGIPIRLAEQVGISAISLLIAGAIALPVGLWIGHTGRGATLAVNLANIGRAIPSLAAIGIVAPDHPGARPEPRLQGLPDPHRDDHPRHPADPGECLRGRRRGRPRPRRGGPRDGPPRAPDPRPGRGPDRPAGDRRRASARPRSRSSPRRPSGALFGFGGLGRYLVDGVAQSDDGQLFGGVFLVAVLALAAEGGFALLQRLADLARPAPGPVIREARASVAVAEGPA